MAAKVQIIFFFNFRKLLIKTILKMITYGIFSNLKLNSFVTTVCRQKWRRGNLVFQSLNPAALTQSHWSPTAQSPVQAENLNPQAAGFLVLSRTNLLFMRVQASVYSLYYSFIHQFRDCFKHVPRMPAFICEAVMFFYRTLFF